MSALPVAAQLIITTGPVRKRATHRPLAQLEIADKLKAPFSVILGQKEVLDGTVIIRDMESGVQEIVDVEKVVGLVAKRLQDMKDMKAGKK